MFKNLILFRVNTDALGSLIDMAEALGRDTFAPCAPTQALSCGWVPPRDEEHGDLLVTQGQHALAKLMIEQRTVPASAVKKRVDELAKQIEGQTGRKPGKKQRKELAEDAKLELLPRAFPRQTSVQVWIDLRSGILAIDAGSASRAGLAVEALVFARNNLVVTPLQTVESPAAVMKSWLCEGEATDGFQIDTEIELKRDDEAGATVSYKNHELNASDMARHIHAGKLPTKLALTFKGRVSFKLTDSCEIKKIGLLDSARSSVANNADEFDAAMFIATTEMAAVIESLVGALGGYPEEAAE